MGAGEGDPARGTGGGWGGVSEQCREGCGERGRGGRDCRRKLHGHHRGQEAAEMGAGSRGVGQG